MKANNKKIIATVLLSSMLIATAPTMVMAEDVGNYSNQQGIVITPRFSYIADAMADLSISNGTATVDCWVTGNYGEATKTKVIAELQLKSGNSWMAYGTWTDTQNNYEASVYETKSVKQGNTYRVKATVTVWEGNQSESHILFTEEMTA